MIYRSKKTQPQLAFIIKLMAILLFMTCLIRYELSPGKLLQMSYYVLGHPKFFIVNPMENLTGCQQMIQFSKRQPVEKSMWTIDDLELVYRNKTLSGGRFRPERSCSELRTAIIIPYRNRMKHLQQFLSNVPPKLLKQKIDFNIFIIHQAEGSGFNRGLLSNIGFVEAMKSARFDCIIFNDVDTLIEDDRNLYQCNPDKVRHLVSSTDEDEYWIDAYLDVTKIYMADVVDEAEDVYSSGTPGLTRASMLPYYAFVGGIIGFTPEQYQRIHGYSNQFFLWGGEDDDLYRRIVEAGYNIERPPDPLGAVTKLKHVAEKKNEDRFALMEAVKKDQFEGLGSIEYHTVDYKLHKLFTWITVDVDEDAIKRKMTVGMS